MRPLDQQTLVGNKEPHSHRHHQALLQSKMLKMKTQCKYAEKCNSKRKIKA